MYAGAAFGAKSPPTRHDPATLIPITHCNIAYWESLHTYSAPYSAQVFVTSGSIHGTDGSDKVSYFRYLKPS